MRYLVAGMPRSGSTWLFNAVRLVLAGASIPDVGAGWIEDRDLFAGHANEVMKVHSFDSTLARDADVIVTSHRDLRDAVASHSRKFQSLPTLDLARRLFADYEQWARRASFDLQYEHLLEGRLPQLIRLGLSIGLPKSVAEALPYEKILAEIEAERFQSERRTPRGYDAVNLLHDGHVTDGRHGAWRGQLSPEVAGGIEQEFGLWMQARGYLETRGQTA